MIFITSVALLLTSGSLSGLSDLLVGLAFRPLPLFLQNGLIQLLIIDIYILLYEYYKVPGCWKQSSDRICELVYLTIVQSITWSAAYPLFKLLYIYFGRNVRKGVLKNLQRSPIKCIGPKYLPLVLQKVANVRFATGDVRFAVRFLLLKY